MMVAAGAPPEPTSTRPAPPIPAAARLVLSAVAALGLLAVALPALGRLPAMTDGASPLTAAAGCRPIEEDPDSGIVACAHADAAPAAAPRGEPPLRELAGAVAPDGSEIVYGPAANGGTLGIPCVGDGSSGNRIQALYVVPAGRPDRAAEVVPLIRRWAADVDRVLRLSAAERNARRHFRWVHSSTCVLSVGRVTVSAAAATSFSRTIADLAAKGFRRADRRYLIWMDANAYCGIGRWIADDRPWRSNRNNGSPYGPASYARTDVRCWGLLSEGQSVEAHELMHTIGAVQSSAPRSTLAGHCRDEHDTMCYPDGGRGPMRYVCPPPAEAYLDCGKNDYFDPRPAAGSYLAVRWNTARSSFMTATAVGDPLIREAAQQTVSGTLPTALATVRLAWKPVTDDPLARTEIEQSIDGGPFVARSTVVAPAIEATLEVDRGRRVQLRLRVVDAGGRWSPWWVFPPVDAVADDAPLVLSAPEIRVVSSTGPLWSIEVAWAAVDDGAIVAHQLEEQVDGAAWTPTGSFTQPFAALGRAPNHAYRYRVRVQDEHGQWSAWVEGTALTLADAPPAVSSPPIGEIVHDTWIAGELVSVAVAWSSEDDLGVVRHDLEQTTDGVTWTPLALADPADSTWIGSVPAGMTVRWRVRATDGGGNASGWVEGPPLTVPPSLP